MHNREIPRYESENTQCGSSARLAALGRAGGGRLRTKVLTRNLNSNREWYSLGPYGNTRVLTDCTHGWVEKEASKEHFFRQRYER